MLARKSFAYETL